MPDDQPCFLDVEASSLMGGFPVEVAWCSADLRRGATYLIRPTPAWRRDLGWSAEAESLHGLSYERLHAEGLDPPEVAVRLAEDLRHAVVRSDNATFDGGWLEFLFDPLPFALDEARPPGVPALMREHGLRPHVALDDAVGLAIACDAFGRDDRLALAEALDRGRALIERAGRRQFTAGRSSPSGSGPASPLKS